MLKPVCAKAADLQELVGVGEVHGEGFGAVGAVAGCKVGGTGWVERGEGEGGGGW